MTLSEGGCMQIFIEVPEKAKMTEKDVKNESGLQKLAAYYQSLFEIEENYNYYSTDEYQNAKRKFVKYLMLNRAL